jgi:HlyD family secretion protein
MARENDKDTENIHQILASEKRKASHMLAIRNLVILALVVLVAYVGISNFGKRDAAFTYTTINAKRGDLTVQVTATGSLKPLNEVDVGTEVSGTLESVEVDFNDQVKANQVLAVIDREQLEAKLRQSRASLALAEASVLEAQATFTEVQKRLRRVKELIAKKLSSEETLDTAVAASTRAEAGLAVARAKADQAQAQVDADRRALEKAVIRSPIDGIVLERRVEPGQTVAASFQTPVLFVLAENLEQMELQVDVDEADVGKVSVGLPADFSVDAYPNRVFPATIKKVHYAPKNAEGVVTYLTLLAVDNADLSLRPGMTATADITVQSVRDAVLIPNAALRFDPLSVAADNPTSEGGGILGELVPSASVKVKTPSDSKCKSPPCVWVERDGRPFPLPVKTGATNGVYTQLLEGEVEPGTPLLVDMRRAGS